MKSTLLIVQSNYKFTIYYYFVCSVYLLKCSAVFLAAC